MDSLNNQKINAFLGRESLMKSIQLASNVNASLNKAFEPRHIESLNIRNYHLADYQYEIIRQAIIDFESSLDQDHEIAIKLAAFGQTILLNVTDLGYSNPSLIHFYGYVDGSNSKAELIQHISQLNFLMLAVRKPEPEKPPRRIGFQLEPAQSDDSELEE